MTKFSSRFKLITTILALDPIGWIVDQIALLAYREATIKAINIASNRCVVVANVAAIFVANLVAPNLSIIISGLHGYLSYPLLMHHDSKSVLTL